jgi:creatinine amidohydrolase/Fe(II)-dependent formamide hydrolase-like protein
MRYELMLPHQIRQAIDSNVPLVLPMGVLEYHGEHLAVGMDTLVVVRALEILEQEMPLVILPAFYYGSASYVVEAGLRNGTIQVDCEELLPFAQGLFRSLLKIGFRNIHGIIHHQSENFAAGMPTDLAFKTSAKKAIFDYLERERGEGWWGQNEMSDYYDQHEKGVNPFNWIRFHPLMDEQMQKEYPFDHAGVGETSLMMSLCPEGVDMKRFKDEKWYSRTARDATKEFGDTARERILNHLRSILKK